MSGAVLLSFENDGAVARVVFDRPQARNALTFEMYAALGRICSTLAARDDLRLIVFRGAGGRALSSGTDIAELRAITSGEDGLAYERSMDDYLDQIASLPTPTLVVVDRLAVGGGLNIAAACDIRIASDDALFGAPIARTLGGCLSMRNFAGVARAFGESRAKRMLMLGDLLSAQEALDCGFLARLAPVDGLDALEAELIERALANAPITQAATKAALARIAQGRRDGEDLIAGAYGSADFAEGVSAFFEKRPPQWRGR